MSIRTRSFPGFKRSSTLDDTSKLRCAGLPELVALKLYARSRRDQADVVELLARNPTADLAAIRAECARFDLGALLESLIEEAVL